VIMASPPNKNRRSILQVILGPVSPLATAIAASLYARNAAQLCWGNASCTAQ
jgi:hypothetical protein